MAAENLVILNNWLTNY